jgi:cytochrome c-type biogenesis protein CcmH
MLWIIGFIILICTVAGLVIPLLRKTADNGPARVDYDITVYRNQLTEIDQDIERGILTKDQAAAARTEIHRRMLAAEDAETKIAPRHTTTRRSQLAMAGFIAFAVTVASMLLYAFLGTPELPSHPTASRTTTEIAAAKAATQLAAEAEKHPSAETYKKLATIYSMMHDFEKAMDAWRHTIKLTPKDAEAWAQMGETIVMASDGAVVPQAMQAFIHALELDPHDPRSQFYLGLAETQIGNIKKAVAIWRRLEKQSKSDADYLPMLKEHIESFAKEGNFDPATIKPERPPLATLKAAIDSIVGAGAEQNMQATQSAPPPNPASPPAETSTDAEDSADRLNAAQLQASQAASGQDATFRGMVDRLVAKLEQDPDDTETWYRLAKAYQLLGDREKARTAIDNALSLEPDNDSILQLREEIE